MADKKSKYTKLASEEEGAHYEEEEAKTTTITDNKNADHPPELILLKSTESDNNYHLNVANLQLRNFQNQWTSIKANSSLLSFLSKFTPSKRHHVYKSMGINKAWDTIRYGIFKMPNSNLNPFVRTSLIRASAEKSPDKSSSNDIETTLPIYNGGNNVKLRKCDRNTYEFDLKISEWLTSWLRFEVWDENTLTHSDTFIGAVSIHISEIKEPQQRYYTQLPLIYRDNKQMVGILHVKAIQKRISDVFDENIHRHYVLEVEILAITNMTTFKLGNSMDKKKFWCQLFVFLVYLLFYALIMFVSELHTDTGINEYKHSIWFVLVTITTVGYGDIYTQTSYSKILNSFFIIINTIIIATLVYGYNAQLESRQDRLNKHLNHVSQGIQQATDNIYSNKQQQPTDYDEKNDEEKLQRIECIVTVKSKKLKLNELAKLDDEQAKKFKIQIYVNICLFIVVLLFGFFTLGVALLLTGPNWNDTDNATTIFVNSLYYALVSIWTVGYGDIYPKPSARILGLIFILFGTIMVIRVLLLVFRYVRWKNDSKKLAKVFLNSLTSTAEFFEFDIDGDGWVSRYEFLRGMLLKLDMIDNYKINQIMSTFNDADIDGEGLIDRNKMQLRVEKLQMIAKYGEDGWNEIQKELESIKRKQRELEIKRKQLKEEREKWEKTGENEIKQEIVGK